MIYLDYNSTTPVDPRVLEEMLPYFTQMYANSASNHRFGIEVNQKVKEARVRVANLIGAAPEEITFTSGATEAINLALKGVIGANPSGPQHIITVSTEHPAVLDTCRFLENLGVEVTYLRVAADGLISLEDLRGAFRSETILVSVMHVNNETGVIQPIKEIAQLAHDHGALFMSDATQAVGKIQVDVRDLKVDLMAFSAHKFYGPKGIGGLYRNQTSLRRDGVEPQLHGGGHELGMRSGTLNVPGIIGIGKAAEIASQEMGKDKLRIQSLRDKLEGQLLEKFDACLNGHKTERIYNTVNILFKGIDNDAMLLNLKEIAVSNGSACSSFSMEPSHVLISMGLNKKEANSSLRFSLGRFNTEEDIVATLGKIEEIISRLKVINA
jgi:cysteine desulfurase